MTSTTTTKLTLTDLRNATNDDRHNGFGYAESRYLSDSRRERLDRAVVAVANELGLTYETLFLWADSKYGRHLCDMASHENPTRKLVRLYLSQTAMQTLYDEVGVTPEDEDDETDLAYQRASDITEGPALARVREGLGAVLMEAAEEKARIDDEILSPASITYVDVPTNYGSAIWSARIVMKDGSRFRVEAVQEA